jgi:hypothetical protein
MRARWRVSVAMVASALVAAAGAGEGAVFAQAHPSSALKNIMVLRGVSNLSALARSSRLSLAPQTARPSRQELARIRMLADHELPSTAIRRPGGPPPIDGSPVKGPANLALSFAGLNSFDQRFANNGNQFSLEPPDQGLCAGDGFVLETVNSVLRVYRMTGAPVTAPVDLNTFYHYPAQFNRSNNQSGPFITDPSCYFDPQYHRWVHVVSTLEVKPATGAFSGPSHLDIAVSATPNPAGRWRLYSIPTEDNGSRGTPNHHCIGGPCFGDFPHIGADANGFYITTNEYPNPRKLITTPPFGYTTAQLYAIARAKLTSGASSINFVHIDNVRAAGTPGFTVWPASSPPTESAQGHRGTEYFLSSDAAAEVGNSTGASDHLILWTLSNTRSLLSANPQLHLRPQVLHSERYSFPPLANQKPGPVPLAKCLNMDCLAFGVKPPQPLHEGRLDSQGNESSVHHTWYSNGIVQGALDTAVRVGGQVKAGVAWFMVRPGRGIVRQGYLGVRSANLTYPTVTTLASGRGVISFTLTGRRYFPSASYAFFPPTRSTPIHVAAAGVGPQDGFTEYGSDPAIGPTPPRWGDYGAGVAVGNSIWFGTEYIAQRCTLSQFLKDPTCNATRGPLTNWATRISRVSIR